MKKLIIFDLDGTLTYSKTNILPNMVELLDNLLKDFKVAIIAGGAYTQFQNQLLFYLKKDNLSNMFLFPTCATAFYKYDYLLDRWSNVYKKTLTPFEKQKIMTALNMVFTEYEPRMLWGEMIEDRDTQITFSALGQKAPLEFKIKFDPDQTKRKIWKNSLEKLIPEFEIRIGGTTSIDITKKGIDKAYGIEQIEKHLGIKKEDMLFIGDALFEGGNDYPVKRTGVECIEVKGPEDVLKINFGKYK